MSINKKQLREEVIRPVLKYLDPVIPYSKVAEDLIMGTIAQESHLGTYLKQLGKGPALGICQMEPFTHDDIWDNYIIHNQGLTDKITGLTILSKDLGREMIGNLYYSVAMCRVHYRRVPKSLPKDGDIEGLAAYWKKYYNTYLGAGTIEEFINNYSRFVL